MMCFGALRSDGPFRARGNRPGAIARRGARLPGSLIAFLVSAVFMTTCPAVTIDWVTVGDPGNAADTTGYPNLAGAVAESFQIMKYEFTNQQYTAFLNSVAAADPYSLYNSFMGSDPRGGITRSGSSGSFTYSVRSNMGDKPVNFVTWYDAARVANWLMNGATSSSSTETGAYTFVGGQTSGFAPARNGNATFYLPTDNQWYKAAYYKGGSTNAGYWDYATQSDTAPTAVTSGSTGIGSAGSTGNFANYAQAADWNGLDGNLTTVGTNGGPSAYGAFDMSGNSFEWNDLDGLAGVPRTVRGGSWEAGGFYLSSLSQLAFNPDFGDSIYDLTFRLARPVAPSAIPEIDPAGLGSVLALVTGTLGLVERRRQRQRQI